jgi:hypothetical protein
VVRWVRSGDGSASGRGGEEVGDRDSDSMERYPMSSILIPRSNSDSVERYPMSSILIPRSNSDSVSPKIFFGSSQEGNMRKFLSDVFDFYIPTPSRPMSGSAKAKSQSLFVLLCR